MSPVTLRVMDFKFGRKRVYSYDVLSPAVFNETGKIVKPEVVRPNLQMASYALGALEKFGLMADYTHVTMTIIQPFVNHVSEFTCTVEELLEVREFLRAKSIECDTSPVFEPSEDNCHYCKAKDTCVPRANAALAIALEGFEEDIDVATVRTVPANELGSVYEKIGLLTDFCKDIAKRVYAQLMAGNPVMRNDGTRFKLVAGKKGDRHFDDEAAVVELLKSFRLKQDQMYQQPKLQTLTALESLAKTKRVKKGETPVPPVIGPTQWAKVVEHIKQNPGAPAIAHESDPRPEFVISQTEFDEVDDDLFN